MAWLDPFPGMARVEERAERAWRLPIGAASPLWAAFGAAAGAGMAWWWLTRWTPGEAFAKAVLPRLAAKPSRIEIIAEPAPGPTPAVEAAVEPVVEPTPAPEALEAEAPLAGPDDLTRMVGIGPKLAEALAARGVTRFADIAAWTDADLADVDVALSLKGRAVREAWVDQAKKLAAGG